MKPICPRCAGLAAALVSVEKRSLARQKRETALERLIVAMLEDKNFPPDLRERLERCLSRFGGIRP